MTADELRDDGEEMIAGKKTLSDVHNVAGTGELLLLWFRSSIKRLRGVLS